MNKAGHLFIYSLFFQDAVDTVCNYFHPSHIEKLVENLINGVLERSTTGRRNVGQLLARLIKEHIVLRRQFEAELVNVLKASSDLLVDMPKLWDYLGELIGKFSDSNNKIGHNIFAWVCLLPYISAICFSLYDQIILSMVLLLS